MGLVYSEAVGTCTKYRKSPKAYVYSTPILDYKTTNPLVKFNFKAHIRCNGFGETI